MEQLCISIDLESAVGMIKNRSCFDVLSTNGFFSAHQNGEKSVRPEQSAQRACRRVKQLPTEGNRTNVDHFRVPDTRAGRDGADILRNILNKPAMQAKFRRRPTSRSEVGLRSCGRSHKLNFADVSAVDITLPNPLPVKDIITVADWVGLKLIKASDLLARRAAVIAR